MTASRREILIAEMGLGPVWRLRDRAAEAAARAVSAAPEKQAVREPPKGAPARPQPAGPAGRNTVPALGTLTANPADDSAREQAILGMSWTDLQQAVAGCTACGLCRTRKNTVFGVGDAAAQWMIVGEAPGSEEDAGGVPFVGQAGHLLDNMLASLDMSRGKNVYIANVLKCRPPGNRNPEPAEVAQCSPYLVRQVALIQPRLILALGRFAAQALLNTDASIASLRGRLHEFNGVPVIVSYHPAYLLRSQADKAKAWEDLVFARRAMADLISIA